MIQYKVIKQFDEILSNLMERISEDPNNTRAHAQYEQVLEHKLNYIKKNK